MMLKNMAHAKALRIVNNPNKISTISAIHACNCKRNSILWRCEALRIGQPFHAFATALSRGVQGVIPKASDRGLFGGVRYGTFEKL